MEKFLERFMRKSYNFCAKVVLAKGCSGPIFNGLFKKKRDAG
jgi:hypothetical protein